MLPVDLTPEEPSNIIAINADAERQLEITRAADQARNSCGWQHKRVTVNSEKRTLTCDDCGFVIDPFTYVEAWANDGERRMTGLKGIDARSKIARAEYEDLMRKVKNMRAQLKCGGCPQPQVEKWKYDNQRLNA